MNLLFAINQDFAGLFASCIRSIVENGGEEHYDAYILHSDLEPVHMSELQRAAGERVTCRFLSVPLAWFDRFPETKRYPRQIYYRLAAPQLLPEDLDRVLYLDVDTVVINPLRELYETDFEGAWFVACTHVRKVLSKLNQVRLGVEDGVPYVNTGVLLMNLPQLRQHFRLEEVRDYAIENRFTLALPDQDILTALYGTKIKLADTLRYNLSDRILAFYNADPRNEDLDLDWVRDNAVILHYCGRNKPWKDSYAGKLGVFYEPYMG